MCVLAGNFFSLMEAKSIQQCCHALGLHTLTTHCLTGATSSPASSSPTFMMNVIQIVRDHWVHILVPMGFVLGCYLDRRNDEKLTAFRNKSLLFKRELRPNEEVTWK